MAVAGGWVTFHDKREERIQLVGKVAVLKVKEANRSNIGMQAVVSQTSLRQTEMLAGS
jgi:hypothetical protein